MKHIVINVYERGRCKPRLIPILGRISEQSAPVTATPQFRGGKKGRLLMAFQLSDSQHVPLSIAAVDKKGKPAKLDGAPEWLVDNTELLALTPSADGMSCDVAAVGPLGIGTVTVKADADLGAGRVELIGTLEIEVTGGQATNVVINPGAPSEQP